MRHRKGPSRADGLSTKTTVALMVIIFLIAVGGTLIAYTIYHNVYVAIFEIEFDLSESHYIGFNADANLNFGKIPQGGSSAIKEMNVFNDYHFPILVHFEVEGEAAPFVQIDANDFVLQPGEMKHVKWSVSVHDEPLGTYKGRATVVYQRV